MRNTITIKNETIKNPFSDNIIELLLWESSIKESIELLTDKEKQFIKFFWPKRLVDSIKHYIKNMIKNAKNNEEADKYFYQAILFFDLQNNEGYRLKKIYFEKLLELGENIEDYTYIYYELNELYIELVSIHDHTNWNEIFNITYSTLKLNVINKILKSLNKETRKSLPQHSSQNTNLELTKLSNIIANSPIRKPQRNNNAFNDPQIDNKLIDLVKKLWRNKVLQICQNLFNQKNTIVKDTIINLNQILEQ